MSTSSQTEPETAAAEAGQKSATRRKPALWPLIVMSIGLWLGVISIFVFAAFNGFTPAVLDGAEEEHLDTSPAYEVGEPIKFDGYTVTVESIDIKRARPDSADSPAFVPAGETLIVAEYAVANTSNAELLDFKPPKLRLRNNEWPGHSEHLAKTAIFANQNVRRYTLGSATLAPGATLRWAAVFQIPEADLDPNESAVGIGDGEISLAFLKKLTTKPEPFIGAGAPTCQPTSPTISRAFNVDRAYPDIAVREGVEGKITVEYRVGPEGDVQDFRVVRAEPSDYFERAVEKEFNRMRWYPALDGGCNATASPVQTQTIVFRLG